MSIFSPFINVIKEVVNVVTGKGGNFVTLLTTLASYLPKLIASITEIMNMHKDGELDIWERKRIIDEAWQEFDDQTGETGISFFKSKTEQQRKMEEVALDHFKEFGKYTCYKAWGVLDAFDDSGNLPDQANAPTT